nr:recombinase family protein [Burkholderia anthinoferrum]
MSVRATTERRAVAYVRMSTEHQQYSTENQLDVIRVFAETRVALTLAPYV